MLCTTEIMATSVDNSDMGVLPRNTTWAICPTYHTVLKASPETANIRLNILFDITSIADWNKRRH